MTLIDRVNSLIAWLRSLRHLSNSKIKSL